MNLATKKVRKIMKNLQVGQRTCFPWAIISAGGLEDRPESPALVGWFGKVFHMEPTDAGLVVERKPDEWNEMMLKKHGII